LVDLKKIIVAIVVVILITLIPQVVAQQISIGEPARQTLEISINEEGDVHVIHNVDNSNKVKQVKFVTGTLSNLKIIDVEGNEPQYAIVGGESGSITLFPTREDVIIEYDLDNVLQQENGKWKWDFLYLTSTVFIFPEDVDLIFVNKRPVKIDDLRGMKCHGCQALIEYVIDEPRKIQQVKWEDKEFVVGIRTLDEITSFNFDQPRRSISFDVNQGNQFVTLAIPLELLWKPYDVYLNEENIIKHEFFTNETHVLLNVFPPTSGTILIIGTSVIPEFPILIPLFFGMTVVILLQFRNKINLHQTHKNKIHTHQF